MEEERAGGGLAVTAGAAGLLDVRLDGARHLVVHDATDVGAVDAHAEGVRGDEERRAAREERLLRGGAFVLGETGVVTQRREALAAEEVVEALHVLAARAVDERRAGALDAAQEPVVLLVAAAGALDLEAEVLADDAAHEADGVAEAELHDHVVLDLAGRGGGEREHGRPAQEHDGGAQAAVVGAEVVAPLADAVGFVDREERDGDARHALAESLALEALGGDVEQLQLAPGGALERILLLRDGDEGVHRGGRDATGDEAVDLVLHQRDERTDDQREARQEQRGDLVADALARARRHHAEDVAAREHGGDDLALTGPEAREAESLPQQGDGLGRGRARGRRERRKRRRGGARRLRRRGGVGRGDHGEPVTLRGPGDRADGGT